MRNIQAKHTTLLFICFSTALLGLFIVFRPAETSSNYAKNRFWTEKTFAPSKFNIVFIGDSRIYRGISTNTVQEYFSDTTEILNFGYSSAGLSSYLIDKALSKLDSNDQNNFVVFGVTPLTLSKKASLNEHIRQEYNRTKTDQLNRLHLSKYLIYFEPTTFSSFIKRLTGNKNGYYETFEKNGWIASNKIPADTMNGYYSYKKIADDLKTDPNVFDSLMLYTNNLTRKHIQVFAFRPPTTKSLKRLEDSLIFFNEKDFIEKFEKAGGKWIEIPDTMSFFAYDGSHLEKFSAIKLSNFIGSELKRQSMVSTSIK